MTEPTVLTFCLMAKSMDEAMAGLESGSATTTK
jgi:hypothetical protein